MERAIPVRSFDEIDRIVAARRCGCGRPLRSTGEGARQLGAQRFRLTRLACDDCEEETVIYFDRSEEHTSELQSQSNIVCRLLLEKKKK